MIRKPHFIFKFLVAALVIGAVLPAAAQQRVTITWFVGLGTGSNSEQITIQERVVREFNESQDEIELVLNIAASNETARDTLSTLIAAGNAPDIVGPVGVAGSNAFADQWLDIVPLIESTGFDLSVFDPALVELYRRPDGGLDGLPFAVYPVITYYNPDLFDEAGLEYPPSEFGAPYILDGEEVPWDYNTVAEIAKILTVDRNGNDATSPDFDITSIEQFGMNFQWARIRLIWTNLQPSSFYDSATNTVSIPEEWAEATRWYHNAIWGESFAPNATYSASELLQPSAFASGNVAMAITPLWYTCCLDNSVGRFEWNIAPVPASFDGVQHVALDADTFRITRASRNPEAAFKVLTYLVTTAAPTLASAYGAYPALPEAQQLWVDAITGRYPWEINWNVASDSLAYAVPGTQHHESNVPNFSRAYDREFSFLSLIEGDTGATIDIEAELARLESDLQNIVNGN